MKGVYKALFGLLYAAGVIFILWTLVHGHTVDVLMPRGIVASQERSLMIMAALLMLVVVIPVFVLTAAIAWRYRASNTKAAYRPDFDHHVGLELLWWAIPLAIIGTLSVVAWQSSHKLDPYRPLSSGVKPLTVEVVALQWKWLFIYPDQHIATVNYLQIPVNTPVDFQITADAPMNSFWIPQLGGQVYAMPGMNTQLHLEAGSPGTFQGSSANISGAGFASMHFETKATSRSDFDQWVNLVQQSKNQLGFAEYNTLAKPNTLPAPEYYSWAEPALFADIINKFMAPVPMPAHSRYPSKATPAPTPGVKP